MSLSVAIKYLLSILSNIFIMGRWILKWLITWLV